MIKEYKDIFIAIIIASNSFWISIYNNLILDSLYLVGTLANF